MPTGDELVAAARRYIGVPYLWNGKDETGLDCSGLVTLALADLGVPFVHGSGAQIDACEPVSVEEGWETPGALLWREGHDAISTGSGTVEAIRPAVAELGRSATYDGGKVRFTRAGLIPGIEYSGGAVKITSKYGWRTVFGRRNFHRGLDYRSRKGAARIALWSGTVVKVTRGRAEGAGVGRVSNGVAAHAPSLSGNAVTVARDIGGYYVEVHIDPAVRLKVGDRVTAGSTVLGVTDESGSITAAHGHVELWRRNDHDTYYDPTQEFHAAISGRGSATAPPANEEDDDMAARTDEELIQLMANGVARAVAHPNARQVPDALRKITTDAVWGAQVGSGASRRTLAAALVNAEVAARAAQAEAAALRAALAAVRGGENVDYARIDRIIRDAIVDGIDVDVTVTAPTQEN